ncbi:hypothetical protein [Microtetraspora glauca]|uniref:Uncharacterized protein n=1 Tax=Microtetraspora glauca TaxID=1996 RepID=A0ABV3GJW1_MICGL
MKRLNELIEPEEQLVRTFETDVLQQTRGHLDPAPVCLFEYGTKARVLDDDIAERHVVRRRGGHHWTLRHLSGWTRVACSALLI